MFGEHVFGTGREPVLFLPGAGFTGIAGQSVARALSDLATTRMLDLPGTGASDGVAGRVRWRGVADWLAAYMDARGLTAVTAIGHSLGAMCLLALADVHPERVRRLALLDAGHLDLPRLPVSEMGAVGLLAPLVSAIEAVAGPAVLRPFAPGRDAPPTNPATLESRARAWARALGCEASVDDVRAALGGRVGLGPEAMALGLAMYRARLPARLLALRVPCLLAYATWPAMPARARRVGRVVARLARERPDIRLLPVASGHYVYWAAPGKVNEAIRAFIESA